MRYDIKVKRKDFMVPHSVVDRFHSLLMEDDAFNETVMRVALEVAQYYAGQEPLTDDDYQLAYDLCGRITVA